MMQVCACSHHFIDSSFQGTDQKDVRSMDEEVLVHLKALSSQPSWMNKQTLSERWSFGDGHKNTCKTGFVAVVAMRSEMCL